jgi:hypothetical protein
MLQIAKIAVILLEKPWNLGLNLSPNTAVYGSIVSDNTYGHRIVSTWYVRRTLVILRYVRWYGRNTAVFQILLNTLVVVMMLLARAYKQTVLILKYSLLTNIRLIDSIACRFSFSVLLLYLDSCITLSCCPKGIDFLLYSVFFNLRVSYNLVRAQITSIIKALLPIQANGKLLLSLITRQCAKLVLLWAAAVCI